MNKEITNKERRKSKAKWNSDRLKGGRGRRNGIVIDRRTITEITNKERRKRKTKWKSDRLTIKNEQTRDKEGRENE